MHRFRVCVHEAIKFRAVIATNYAKWEHVRPAMENGALILIKFRLIPTERERKRTPITPCLRELTVRGMRREWQNSDELPLFPGKFKVIHSQIILERSDFNFGPNIFQNDTSLYGTRR